MSKDKIEAMKRPVRYAFDDPRRPPPEIGLRYDVIPFDDIGRPDRGQCDLYPLEDFIAMDFTDYDGTGYYAFVTEGIGSHIVKTNQYARPDAMRAGAVDRYWTHVVWYNR